MKKLLFLIFIFLLFPFASFAASIWSEDFNTYTDGDLNGQGNWSQGYGASTFTIQNSLSLEGKAVQITAASENILNFPQTSGIADGRQVFYVRPNQTNASFQITTANAPYPDYTALFFLLTFTNTGKIQYNNVTTFYDYQNYSANIWYKLEVEWRDTDDKYRFRVDEGEYTDWLTFWTSSSPTGMDNAYVDCSGGTFYFDYFMENPYVASTTEETGTSFNNSLIAALCAMGLFFVMLFDMTRRHFA